MFETKLVILASRFSNEPGLITYTILYSIAKVLFCFKVHLYQLHEKFYITMIKYKYLIKYQNFLIPNSSLPKQKPRLYEVRVLYYQFLTTKYIIII